MVAMVHGIETFAQIRRDFKPFLCQCIKVGLMEGIEPLPTIPDLNENSIALNKEMFKLFDLPAGEFCDEYHEQSTLASFQGLEPHVYNPPHYFAYAQPPTARQSHLGLLV